MAKAMLHRGASANHSLMSGVTACATCGYPEDSSPVQQAAVVRSLGRRFAALLDEADPAGVAVPPDPGSWSPFAHATYVGVMLGAIDIRLGLLVRSEQAQAAPTSCPAGWGAREVEVQRVASRLWNHAGALSRIIVTCAGPDWRAAPGPHGISPHHLVHRAIDDATDHLHAAQNGTLRGGSPVAPDRDPSFPVDRREGSDGGAPADTGFTTRLRDEGGRTVVSLRGELDLATAPAVRRALDLAIEAAPIDVVVDLEGLTFADFRGVGEFRRASRRARIEGRQLSLRAPSVAVQRVLRLTGMERLLVVEASDDALVEGPGAFLARSHRSGQPQET